MPCKQLACSGSDELFKMLEEEKDASRIFVLFSGSEDPATGNSWCKDCLAADPVIEECIKKAADSDVFIVCLVGDRDTWKDQKNVFRTHAKLQLKAIPTLVKWGTPERLVEGQCADSSLVSMMVEEE